MVVFMNRERMVSTEGEKSLEKLANHRLLNEDSVP
jgi:hypothetical protein